MRILSVPCEGAWQQWQEYSLQQIQHHAVLVHPFVSPANKGVVEVLNRAAICHTSPLKAGNVNIHPEGFAVYDISLVGIIILLYIINESRTCHPYIPACYSKRLILLFFVLPGVEIWPTCWYDSLSSVHPMEQVDHGETASYWLGVV